MCIRDRRKGADMIVANSIREPNAGFQGDTNVATFILPEGNEEQGCLTKYELGHRILNRARELYKEK